MKSKLLTLLLFIWIGSFGQNPPVPNTTTFTLVDVDYAIMGSLYTGIGLDFFFTYSDAAKFDPAYGSKTMSPKTLYGFRNYGYSACTRPAQDATALYLFTVNGVTVTSVNYKSLGTTPCGYPCAGYTAQTTNVDGCDIYIGTGTDCTKVPDGYYGIWCSSCDTPQWLGVRVTGGKRYFDN